MTRLWWVRHGPTHEKAFVGQRDVPADLSDHAQIARLEAALPRDAPVIASDLSRASATADAIVGNRRRLPDLSSLREFDFGHWDGLTFEAVAARDPVLSRRFWEEPGDLTAPGGESWNDVARRVSGAVDQLLDLHRPDDLIIVAHIGVIMTQIARVAETTPYQAMGHQIDNLSITRLSRTPTGWTLEQVNHVP